MTDSLWSWLCRHLTGGQPRFILPIGAAVSESVKRQSEHPIVTALRTKGSNT